MAPLDLQHPSCALGSELKCEGEATQLRALRSSNYSCSAATVCCCLLQEGNKLLVRHCRWPCSCCRAACSSSLAAVAASNSVAAAAAAAAVTAARGVCLLQPQPPLQHSCGQHAVSHSLQNSRHVESTSTQLGFSSWMGPC